MFFIMVATLYTFLIITVVIMFIIVVMATAIVITMITTVLTQHTVDFLLPYPSQGVKVTVCIWTLSMTVTPIPDFALCHLIMIMISHDGDDFLMILHFALCHLIIIMISRDGDDFLMILHFSHFTMILFCYLIPLL